MTLREYLRSLLTPGNAIVALILLLGVPAIVYRFAFGIGAASNLTQVNPWGIWIGFDVLSGVALAAGGFTIATAVYVFGMDEYHPIVRPAVLTGFLGYAFVVIGLCADLGRPVEAARADGLLLRHRVGDVRGRLVRGAAT